MRKKIILGSAALLLVGLVVMLWFSGRGNIELPKEGEVTPVTLTKEERATIQQRFHNEALGFIYQIYALDATRYLVFTKADIMYTKALPGDQLVWVEKKDDDFVFTSVYNGSYPIQLVLTNKQPYITQVGEFYFAFYEGKGTTEYQQKGKGYVYRVDVEKGVEKIYETKGNYYKFGLDKQKRMLLIEKDEVNHRNRYPSYFAPYRLTYLQYSKGEWTKIQEKIIEPDLQIEYEKYEQKHNQN